MYMHKDFSTKNQEVETDKEIHKRKVKTLDR